MLQCPIQTYCRIKPPSRDKHVEQMKYAIDHGDKNIIIGDQTFFFDNIFGPTAPNNEIFDKVLIPLIQHTLSGINSTLLAYGQTGGGKTYTVSDMINKTLQYMMSRANNSADMYLSYVQLYSEKCYDLLNYNKEVSLKSWTFDLNNPNQMNGRTNGLNIRKLSCLEEAMAYIALGNKNKVTAVTKMNATSSRSHSMCTIYLSNVLSKLHLVDLAGSEQFFSLNDDYLLRNEARKINLSLHYLEQVMIALDEPQRNHIPYRNSILTTFLRDSLGGNSVTSLIAVVSMEKDNHHQTLATLKFAQRTLRVTNYVLDNRSKYAHLESSDSSRNPLVYNIIRQSYKTKNKKKLMKEIEKLEHKVKLRDKEIGVLLEMLTTAHETDSHCQTDRMKPVNSGDDLVMFTDIDAMFRTIEDDSFMDSNFKMFQTSEEKLGSQSSNTSVTEQSTNYFEKMKNQTCKRLMDSRSVMRRAGNKEKQNSINSSCSSSNKTNNDTQYSGKVQSKMTESSSSTENYTIIDSGCSSNNKTNNDIQDSGKVQSKMTQSSSYSKNHTTIDSNNNSKFFKYSLTNSCESKPNKSDVIMKKHIENYNYNPFNQHNKYRDELTDVSILDIDDSTRRDDTTSFLGGSALLTPERTNSDESKLDRKDKSKLEFKTSNFHVYDATVNNFEKSDETFTTDAFRSYKSDKDHSYEQSSNSERSHHSKQNTTTNLTNPRIDSDDRNRRKSKKKHHRKAKGTDIEIFINKVSDEIKEIPNDKESSTHPSIVENIEQYLTGDDVIDEEIIQFYARRGIVVEKSKK